MSQGPPKAIETVVALLIPPARREEVLGDLHERYRGPAAYLVDAVRTVPHVIASDIRRTTDYSLVISEALALYLAFAITLPGSIASLFHRATAVPCTILSFVAVAVLVLMEAYVRPGGRTERRLCLQSLGAAAVAWAVGELMRAMDPALALPIRSLTVGSVFGALLVWRAAAGESLLYRRKPDKRAA